METDPKCTVWSDLVQDLTTRTARAAVAAVAVSLWLAFSWGLGNDVLLAVMSARVYNAIDPGTGIGVGVAAVALAAASGGLLWAVVQVVDSLVVLSALGAVPRLSLRLRRWVGARFPISSFDQMRPMTRWMVAYGLGASALCLLDVMAGGEAGASARRRVIAHGVALSAGSVTLIVALVTGLTMAGRRNPRLAPVAERFAEIAAAPWFWIAMIATLALVRRIIGRCRAGRGGPATGAEPGISRAAR